ncbi:MAG TPA: Uma2 family endonuclease [Candidatus Elarobacter sp.]|jgi:Uma2 family endonuclease|nr:Uma2 family endonuclease [Candidatus Elarobacter sp.]
MLAPVPIPETKPATELIDGRLVQKMSPKRRHQELELRWTLVLRAWGGARGDALHEWRHEFTAPGRTFASLVPDVAYESHEALDELGPAASEKPPRAPEIAVEILSAGESELHLAWKTAAYLAGGTRVVFVVDPPRRTVIAHAGDGVIRFGPGETVVHDSLPGFAYAIDEMFEGLYLG